MAVRRVDAGCFGDGKEVKTLKVPLTFLFPSAFFVIVVDCFP